jgi:23S rRNA (cytosine1962-C5)-methyltransferase
MPPASKIPTLRLRLKPAAESIVRAGHPWVFAESFRYQNRDGATGELAVIFDRNNRFLAVGLYDAASPLRVRILHSGKPVSINSGWWKARAAEAFARRRNLFDGQTTGFRLIHGESDGWPGLVLDQYQSARVMKIYTAAWLPRLAETADLLQGEGSLVLRLSRNLQDLARDEFGLTDGQVLRGPALERPVVFLESGLRFEADVLRGQKTGFFLDQRENRRNVEALARGRSVLNLFSFSGGFSLYAARGGATNVCSLDVSEHALEAARRNFALNQNHASIARCRHETIQADAFAWLQAAVERRFDLIIIDPPSLARRAADKNEARAAYARLIEAGIARLQPYGILVAASCSAHVTAEEFFALARNCAKRSGRKSNELRTTSQPADHPAAFAEARYLKCIYFSFA